MGLVALELSLLDRFLFVTLSHRLDLLQLALNLIDFGDKAFAHTVELLTEVGDQLRVELSELQLEDVLAF